MAHTILLTLAIVAIAAFAFFQWRSIKLALRDCSSAGGHEESENRSKRFAVGWLLVIISGMSIVLCINIISPKLLRVYSEDDIIQSLVIILLATMFAIMFTAQAAGDSRHVGQAKHGKENCRRISERNHEDTEKN